MISCVFNNSLGGRTPTRRGWQRLAEALDHLPSPDVKPSEEARRRMMARIAGEPARVETDVQGAITAINPAFTALCGFSYEEVRGRKPGSFLQGPLTDQELVSTLRRSVAEGTPCVVELVNYHKDGSAYGVLIDLEPLRDEVGTLIGFRAVETKTRDIPGA